MTQPLTPAEQFVLDLLTTTPQSDTALIDAYASFGMSRRNGEIMVSIALAALCDRGLVIEQRVNKQNGGFVYRLATVEGR